MYWPEAISNTGQLDSMPVKIKLHCPVTCQQTGKMKKPNLHGKLGLKNGGETARHKTV